MMKTLLLSLLPPLLAATAFFPFVSGDRSTASPKLPFDYHRCQCDCYVVSGPEPGYFENYAFWDFRRIPLPDRKVNVEQSDNSSNPLLLTKRRVHNSESEPQDTNSTNRTTMDDDEDDSSTLLLSHTAFAYDWKPQKWHRHSNSVGPVPLLNSPENVFFARNPLDEDDPESTHLVLRATRFSDHTATAEIEHYLRNVFHCSLRVRMRVMSMASVAQQPKLYGHYLPNNTTTQGSTVPSGACAGIFIYRSSTCESDIEILTSDPHTVVRYANQPDYDPVTDTAIPEAGSIGILSEPWTNPTTHRVDWLHDISRWYANDELQASKRYGVPSLPSIMAINLWSNGGNWTGDLSVGQSVYVGIEWIEFAYNTSLRFRNAPDDIVPVERHMRGPVARSASEPESDDDVEALEEADRLSERKRGRQCRRPCYLDDVEYS
ncbi:glycoside hydrolase family 16 protein [Aspergillus clavatus NRRL 1]|uniref:Endo-1,3(4)-beta-glucanase, putative n=1 Tax=Aspergillus clavatus (strain ATCC 1007 / CBS 513.65 / DSM 816 / NCTC 3887 / NRRL 1 / QM 1276 / 107) TaxID=344612 RepID=A1CBY7_ASPCL|nr:endo-1,3(4)-beta-glucanase, putative [Aspergillus clavatus NRRL 1]EAW13255.1 endo-1,3(4)-beta-glucanase, putative [Aspergillus clavatus NRRL 1]